jgi:hypothetical protein
MASRKNQETPETDRALDPGKLSHLWMAGFLSVGNPLVRAGRPDGPPVTLATRTRSD